MRNKPVLKKGSAFTMNLSNLFSRDVQIKRTGVNNRCCIEKAEWIGL